MTGNTGGGTGGGGGGAGGGGGGSGGRYSIVTLDSTASDRTFLDLAIDGDKIGVAYFSGHVTPDGGAAATFDLKYVEVNSGTASAPVTVAGVQRMMGVSLDFNPNTHRAAIAYLGGNDGTQLFWFQSDAVVAFQQPNGTFVNDTAASTSGQAVCGNAVSDTGSVVGLWPAAKFDSAGSLWLCYRDIHTGQNSVDAYGDSDVECVKGQQGSWTVRECTVSGVTTNHEGYGDRLAMVMVDNQPAIAFGKSPSADQAGHDVLFMKRSASGWGAVSGALTVNNALAGCGLAYDDTEGYSVAAVDIQASMAQQILYYTHSKTSTFPTADQIFGDGTGGWWPSLAIDTTAHEPVVAYYVCSATQNAHEPSCPIHELRVGQRGPAMWSSEVVDPEGGAVIRLKLTPQGKRVIAYRDLHTGAVKLAVER